jgi:hypothetical protein
MTITNFIMKNLTKIWIVNNIIWIFYIYYILTHSTYFKYKNFYFDNNILISILFTETIFFAVLIFYRTIKIYKLQKLKNEKVDY